MNEVRELPWGVGDDMSMEINLEQEKWRQSKQFSNPTAGTLLPAVLFSAVSRLSHKIPL